MGIEQDRHHAKRLNLIHGESRLPFMTWTAGQREFTPLLLGLYHLLPSRKVVYPAGVASPSSALDLETQSATRSTRVLDEAYEQAQGKADSHGMEILAACPNARTRPCPYFGRLSERSD